MDRKTAARIGAWIEGHSHRLHRIVAICTGVYGLAASGLLANRRVTTHWRYARDLKERHPSLSVDSNALYVHDDKVYASGGITAGIDLSRSRAQPAALGLGETLPCSLRPRCVAAPIPLRASVTPSCHQPDLSAIPGML